MPIIKKNSPSLKAKTTQPIKKVLPLIPLRNVVLFPSVETSLFFGRKFSGNALTHAYNHTNRLVIITAQQSTKTDNPDTKDIYTVGVLARIQHVLRSDDSLHAIVRGLSRVNITKIVQKTPFYSVEFVDLPTISEPVAEVRRSAEALLSQLKKSFAMGRQFDLPAILQLSSGVSSSDLSDQVAFTVNAKISEKQKLLETLLVSQRLKITTEYLVREMEVAQLERDIEKKTQKKFNIGMKRNVLEERKRQIDKELKKISRGSISGLNGLGAKIRKSQMPPAIKKKCTKEYNRLTQMSSMAPEASYIRTYLETLLELPWGKYDQIDVKIKKAQKILDRDHYGLKQVKERILEHLAVIQMKSGQGKKSTKSDSATPNILCFIGPPGVGKTSLGQSIAKALGRQFVRASLGGIRDEAEIRGHRRTYVGAMPGRIVKGLQQAGSFNPVFMLDEVDKVGADYRGDPSAALLETLDPEQNKEFSDHYIDSPIDLSQVFFILTGNIISTIPGPLRDRLEIIDFSSYTQDEKFHIAKKYLISKKLKDAGLSPRHLQPIKNDTIKFLVDKYTHEAGVRELERTFARLFRKAAKQIITKKTKKIDLNNKSVIKKYLGPEKFSSQLKNKKNQVGVSTGLAWTAVGGVILFIEVNIMPGKGKLILTGKLGSVMKESCQAALSFVRSQATNFGIKQNFHKIDIHVHVPQGAIPKDGPSAGTAITTALISALKNKAIPRHIAMTGEVTLRGNVLEIGGLKEKSIAAHRAGLTTIFFPQDNKKSLVEIPASVKKDIKFIPIDSYSHIYKQIFA